MTNAEKIKEMCNNPKELAKFLYERDCNCWECDETPERCNNRCLENMEKCLSEEYDGRYD